MFLGACLFDSQDESGFSPHPDLTLGLERVMPSSALFDLWEGLAHPRGLCSHEHQAFS